jgi:hypothetical protein
MVRRVGQARKFLAALTGAAAEAVSLGLLSGSTERWVTGVLAVATAFTVYLVPNQPAP